MVVPFNFGGLSEEYSNYKASKFVIIPIPYEKTTTYIKGTKNGPHAIIDASRNLELYDEELDIVPAEEGIATLAPVIIDSPPEEMVKKVKETCLRVLEDNKFPIVLGGEHSISVGFFYSLLDKYNNISVLQLDAHADLRDTYEGSRYNHACVMRRIREHSDAVQVGIRSLSKEEADLIKTRKYKIFYAIRMREADCKNEICSTLNDNVFITIDVDVFDPSLIPSVGTPEPGGLGWYEVLDLLKFIVDNKNVVGFDVVELSPIPEIKSPDFIIAKLVYKLIGYLTRKNI
ncbi:MAG: agmatinase [Candidatus Odinarchaeia archaeon]